MLIFNKNSLQSKFSSLSVTLFIQVGNYLSFSLAICIFFTFRQGQGPMYTSLLKRLTICDVYCSLPISHFTVNWESAGKVSVAQEWTLSVGYIQYITTHDHCVTFMVISANRFLLCSSVNHDSLPSLLWGQIFTNVILMKSDSCTLGPGHHNGLTMDTDVSSEYWKTSFEPPFWGVLSNLQQLWVYFLFRASRCTYSNRLETGKFYII